MGQVEEFKVTPATVGRDSLKGMLKVIAGTHLMEKTLQQVLSDLRVKKEFDMMAEEVKDLAGDEKTVEVLSRFLVVLFKQTKPAFLPTVAFQLYTHLRTTGLMDAAKPNIGSIVDLSGNRVPPKEG